MSTSYLPAAAPATSHRTIPTMRGSLASPADRLVRQLQGIDAWNAYRQTREAELADPAQSRDGRMLAGRLLDQLRRTHDTIITKAGEALKGRHVHGPTRPTALIAHRHPWFAERAQRSLQAMGFATVGCTDNGADALGIAIVEQPDVLLAGSSLAMMTGQELVTLSAELAPFTLRTVHSDDAAVDRVLEAAGAVVFPRGSSAEDVVTGIVSRVLGPRSPSYNM